MTPQPLIDLMPESVRKQCELGMRTGRIVGSVAAGILIVIVLATQARWTLDREQQRHAKAIEKAAAVHDAQQQANALMKQLSELRAYTDIYDRVALPIKSSAVIATIINQLPPGITLENLDIEAGERRIPRTSRSVTGDSNQPSRMLLVVVSGFALTNDDISLLMMRLRNLDGFDGVTLDFNRTRQIREVMAREFRMSFHLDLDRPYQVVDASTPAIAPGPNEEGW